MLQGTALIVGAGIGGLAAAVALGRAGWRVRIFERAATPRELGFALNLAPNAMAALGELGLAERLIAEGEVTAAIEIREQDGRVLRRFNVAAERRASPLLSVMALRSAVHGALLDAVDPAALTLSAEAADFAIAPGGVELALADGRRETGDILIGADGVASAIRHRLHPSEPPPRRSGYWAVRGVAHDVGHHLGGLSGAAYIAPGIEAAAVRAGRSAIYWYLSLLAEDVGDLRDPYGVMQRCTAGFDEEFRAIAQATRPDDLRLDELFDRDPIADWGRGPVTLLGDAAHPMLPHTGQGAAQALEDAVALGLALAPGTDPIAALRQYEQVRAARTRPIVKRGRRIVRITTTRSRTIGWLRATGIRIAPVKTILAAFSLFGHRDPHRALRRRASGARPQAPDTR